MTLLPGAGHGATASRLLDMAVEESDAISESPALFSGITGLAWALQHLASFADPSHVTALDDVEASLLTALQTSPVPADFDLMSGLVGIGVLALERPFSPAATTTLERLAVWLEACAEETEAGISWRVVAAALDPSGRDRFPAGGYYPGVAHGTAGVVGFLAGLLRAGVETERAGRLLEGAVPWIVAQEMPGGGGCFPHLTEPGIPPTPARSGWCTGGPGISLMLWRAGRAAGETPWQGRALTLARATMRRPLAEMGIKDACLCHGSSALGQLYARWFNATGDEEFRDEAARWFRRTFDHRRPGEGVAGFSAVNSFQKRREAAPGLLFGAAGVGLSLLAATTDVPPAWDRVFLMSDPPERDSTLAEAPGSLADES